MKSLHRHAWHVVRGVVLLVLLVLVWQVIAAESPRVRITCLHDHTAASAGTRTAWGPAALDVDLAGVDAMLISHEHGVHTRDRPLPAARPGLPAYRPASADRFVEGGVGSALASAPLRRTSAR